MDFTTVTLLPFLKHRLLLILGIAFLLPPSSSGGEIAVPVGGGRITGRLLPDPAGALRFAADGSTEIPPDGIQKILFEQPEAAFAGIRPTHRLELWGRQALSGRFLGIDERQVSLAEAADQPLHIPRARVAAIRQRPGEVVLAQEDFEKPPDGWRASGALELSGAEHLSGRKALRISQLGQAVEYLPPKAVESGRMEVHFWDGGQTAPERHAQLFVELEFRSATGPRPIRVILGWHGDTYSIENPKGPLLAIQPLRRRSGWHRLDVFFGPSRFFALVDDAVLATSDTPTTPLAAIRFGARSSTPSTPHERQPAGMEGYFDDFRLARRGEPVDLFRHDSEQDEVAFANGDELFGTVRQGDSRNLSVSGSFGVVNLPWSDIPAVLLRPRPSEPGSIAGVIVRVRSRPAGETDPRLDDVLEGALRNVSDTAVRIETTAFGLLAIPRDRLRELEVYFRGRRIELDHRFHHLGGTIAPELDDPAPGPNRFTVPFRLDTVPRSTSFVALSVVQMEGMAEGARFADRLRRGELRTYVDVNGHELGFLNKYLEYLPIEPVRIRVPVPAGVLRPGENTITIRQVPQQDDPRQFDDCGVFGLALELEQSGRAN